LTTFSVPIFGALFEVHFCTLFGQFSIADLLVLLDFLAHEGGFWPVFRRVLDRSFHHDFCLPREGVMGHCCPLVAYQVVAALASGPFVDQYQGREVLHAACFGGFLRCWFFPSRFSSRRPFAHSLAQSLLDSRSICGRFFHRFHRLAP
jgi:hypothetical protein